MSYEKRRYRVVNGKLEKTFSGLDSDGWVRSKAEAWANAEKKDEAPKRRGRPPREMVNEPS